jgi:hypothetical protein
MSNSRELHGRLHTITLPFYGRVGVAMAGEITHALLPTDGAVEVGFELGGNGCTNMMYKSATVEKQGECTYV